MKTECLRDQWLVACPAASLSGRPLPVTVLGLPLVLFRVGGVAAALLDRCPHRNASLSKGRLVKEGIQCPYHGWVFSGDGACVAIPGLCGAEGPGSRAAEPVAVQESDGFVWIRLTVGTEAAPPRLPGPEADDPRFDRFLWVSEVPGNFVDALENLLDACHPHYTHAGWLRRPQQRRAVQVRVRRTSTMAEAYYEENLRPKGFVPRLLEGERKASIGRFYPPSTAQLEYEGPRGPQFVLTAWFTPIDETRSRVHALMATPKGWVPAWTKELLLRVIFHRVLEQDRKALLDQQANISRFGGPRFTSTSLDVMRGHILYFLRRTADSPPAEFETTLTMEL